MEFKNKKNKGWILEEIEKKKDECLDANQFGGENPEDVEKHQEEINKEINKRFDGVKKVAQKVVGQDFEEHAKPHKVEVYYVGRKDLGEAIGKLKEQNINYTIKRSPKEGFRYVVEYFSDEHKKDEPLLEKIDLEEEEAKEGFISGAKELSHDELANLEKSLWDKLDELKIHPSDGTFSNSSNRLADLDLIMVIHGDWKHDHLSAENAVEEWCKDNGYVIIKHTTEEIGDSDRDDYEAEHKWFLVKDTDGKMTDTVNTLHQMFTPAEESESGFENADESLKEVLDDEELPDAIPDEAIVVSTEPGDDVATVVEAPSEEVKKAGLYNALSSELRDTLQDIENLKSLTVTFVEEGREDLIDDLNAIMDDRTIHSGMLQDLMSRVEGKVEAEETNTEKPAEEPEIKEESLEEEVQYKVGDRVRIKKSLSLPNSYVGRVGEIKSIVHNSLEVKFDSKLPQSDGKDTIMLYTSEVEPYNTNESLKESTEVGRVELCIMDKNNNNIECCDNIDDAIKFAKEHGGTRILRVLYGPKDEHGDEPELSTECVWKVDESLEEAKEETIHLDKYEIDDKDSAEQKEDAKIMPYGEVTKKQWEDFLSKAKWPYWLAWENLKNEVEHKE